MDVGSGTGGAVDHIYMCNLRQDIHIGTYVSHRKIQTKIYISSHFPFSIVQLYTRKKLLLSTPRIK
jgi:hypothetical protein